MTGSGQQVMASVVSKCQKLSVSDKKRSVSDWKWSVSDWKCSVNNCIFEIPFLASGHLLMSRYKFITDVFWIIKSDLLPKTHL